VVHDPQVSVEDLGPCENGELDRFLLRSLLDLADTSGDFGAFRNGLGAVVRGLPVAVVHHAIGVEVVLAGPNEDGELLVLTVPESQCPHLASSMMSPHHRIEGVSIF